MKSLLEKYLPLRNTDGGGAGGAGAGAGGTGGGAGGADAGAAAGADKDGSNAAAAAAAPAAAAAAGPYRPQGMPDTMFGKDDRETIDKMHTALNGYRTRDAERQVPDKVDAYNAFDAAQAPEAIRAYLPEAAKSPAFAAAAKVAMEHGVPVKTMHAITTAAYAGLQEAGLLEPLVNIEAERTALLPDSAKNLPKADQDKAIDARMQANEDYINLLTKPPVDAAGKPIPGGKPLLDAKVGEHALLMLMDTAQGNQFLEAIRGQMTGEGRAQPFGGSGSNPAAQTARDALKARSALPENTVGNAKFDRASWDQLMADYQKLGS
ncbi:MULTISPECIES: hypothetical protein [unclassified Mesorhizobium]|uniref:hypothetical protein n=1 Tax=unclassified Mesorhizobium TaxID=325217 RepID=UPI0016728D9A|nr:MULTISPECIES: hypothetical protein [unclassified Mesorhizobium]